MPNIVTIMGYKVYFWMNENGEPIHVHVSKGKPSQNATKLWMASNGGFVTCHNKSRIPKHDLQKIISYLVVNNITIVNMWYGAFGYVKYYC